MESSACFSLLPDGCVDESIGVERVTDILAVVLGSERCSSSDDDDDARTNPLTVATIPMLPSPLVTPLCLLTRLREGAVRDSGSGVCSGRESVHPSALARITLQEPICTAMRRRRAPSSGWMKQRIQLLLAFRTV
jgi:hypothetical protein